MLRQLGIHIKENNVSLHIQSTKIISRWIQEAKVKVKWKSKRTLTIRKKILKFGYIKIKNQFPPKDTTWKWKNKSESGRKYLNTNTWQRSCA